MRVRFTVTVDEFKAGQVYDLPELSALRWIQLDVAVPADDEKKPVNHAPKKAS